MRGAIVVDRAQRARRNDAGLPRALVRRCSCAGLRGDRRPRRADACAAARRSPARHHAAEFEEFRLGLDDFLEVETAEEGLGPAFNGTSCAACHNVPAVGGIEPDRRNARRPAHRGRPLRGPRRLRRNAGPPVLAARPRLPAGDPGRCQHHHPPDPDSGVRRRPGRGDRRRRRSWRWPIPTIATATASADAPPSSRSAARAIAASAASAGRRSTPRCSPSAPTPIATRWGSRTTSSATSSPSASTPARMRVCDPIPDPEDIPDPVTRRRGIDNFASFMRFLGAARARRRRRRDARGRAGLRGDRLRRLSRAGADDRPRAAIRCSIAGPSRCSPICCCTTSATGDGIRQASAEHDEIRTPALWGLRHRRPLLHDGSAATIADAILRHGGEAARARAGLRAARRRRARRAAALPQHAVARPARGLSTAAFLGLMRRDRVRSA